MNKYAVLLISLTISIFLTSCSKSNKSKEEAVAEFRSELTEADTLAMLSICDDAMEQLKQKNYDNVLSNLYEYDDSTKEISPLSEQTLKRYELRFKMFPVLDYERQYYSFMLEGCNDVKYQVTFATAEQTGADHDATTMYMFNPVRINGEWKLCVKSASDEFDPEYQ